jgi:hypothetical protein
MLQQASPAPQRHSKPKPATSDAVCRCSDIVRALLCGALLSTREQVQSGSINLQLLFGDVSSHMAFMSKCAFAFPLRARVCV